MIQNLRPVIIWSLRGNFILYPSWDCQRHEILNFKLIREHFRQPLSRMREAGMRRWERSFEACWGAINETTSNILRPADITSSWFWETGTDSSEAARVSFQLCCGKNDLRCLPLLVTSCLWGFTIPINQGCHHKHYIQFSISRYLIFSQHPLIWK